MKDDQLIELFHGFLTQIVEHNTRHKLLLEQSENRCQELKDEFEKFKDGMDEIDFDKMNAFINNYTKRNYTDQEVSDLGAHVYEQHEIYKFHKWFKGKAAIVIGAVAIVITLMTFAEKIVKALEFFTTMPTP